MISHHLCDQFTLYLMMKMRSKPGLQVHMEVSGNIVCVWKGWGFNPSQYSYVISATVLLKSDISAF